jgi:hypothetical protein
LADAVATGNPNSWNSAIDRLLARHKNLLSLEARDVLALLEATKKSFAERYAAAFGPFCKKSRFLRGADALTGAETSASEETSPQLDEVVAEQVEALRNASTTGEERGEAPGRALEAHREAFGVGRLVLLGPSRDRSQLSVVAAAGNETKALRGEFEVPLTRGKDALSSAFMSGKAVSFEDTMTEAATRRLPRRYYEVFGSPALALQPCSQAGKTSGLLLADADLFEDLPKARDLEQAKPLLSQMAAVLAAS